MIDWNKRNGGFLAPESVYEDQLSNLSMQINQLEKQLNKQKEVLDKIKEIFKDYGVKEDIVTYSMYQITGEEVYTILELLEEIE